MKRPDDFKYTGIEAVFRAAKHVTDDRFFEIDQAGLVKWARLEFVELWQAVAIHSFIDPDGLGHDSDSALRYLDDARPRGLELGGDGKRNALEESKIGFFENLDLAERDLRSGSLRYLSWSEIPRKSEVSLAEFYAWATRQDLPVYGGWQSRSVGQAARWTWGKHTTPHLEALEAAAKAHWMRLDEGGQYDPTDPTSASTNDKVAAWIQERFPFVATETAQVMARILRDPNLPAGRPRER